MTEDRMKNYISKDDLIEELKYALKRIIDEAETLGEAKNIAQGAIQNS